MKKWYLAIGLVGCLWACMGSALADPAPGDVYKEIRFDPKHFLWVGGRNSDFKDPNKVVNFSGSVNLSNAIKAEVSVQKLLCHDATRGLAISINKKAFLTFPEPSGVPKPQYAYQHLSYPFVTVPLSHLKSGINSFRLKVDPYGWWPQNLVYGVLLRIYYKSTVKHGTGTITSPKTNGSIGSNPVIVCDVKPPAGGGTARVEFVGYYEDFNYRGDGHYTGWQGHYSKKVFMHHIGTAKSSPFKVTWNTEWLPDQPKPMKIAARIWDTNGYITMTQPVAGIALSRPGISVKMYKPYDIPQQWVTRKGVKSEKFNIPATDNLAKATAARIVWTSWCPYYSVGISINNTKLMTKPKIASKYDIAFHHETINKSVLKNGVNVLSTAHTKGSGLHGMEVQWPGIVPIVRYKVADMGKVSVSNAKADPASVPSGDNREVTFSVNILSTKGTAVSTATIDLSALKGSATQAMTKGPGNAWSCKYAVPAGCTPKTYSLVISAKDKNGVIGSGSVSLTVKKSPTRITPGGSLDGSSQKVRISRQLFGNTSIRFPLQKMDMPRIQLLDCRGRLVQELSVPRGGNTAIWNGRNFRGEPVQAGLYLLRIRYARRKILHRFIHLGS